MAVARTSVKSTGNQPLYHYNQRIEECLKQWQSQNKSRIFKICKQSIIWKTQMTIKRLHFVMTVSINSKTPWQWSLLSTGHVWELLLWCSWLEHLLGIDFIKSKAHHKKLSWNKMQNHLITKSLMNLNKKICRWLKKKKEHGIWNQMALIAIHFSKW